ncbi:TetR/AcrR family transcriptional regulator [Mycobacterium sherrisii]|uniref:TetR family transcriptional regulator n=1 Tax=Mycobacterium sherrisii TaxID=243061 RepID=A0A1E3SNF7_9MYCO|nr:TetR/AcrR family transcriptional regulator [Mycobacterium sherrisii]MCV7027689.1 TetR/AcrR family transcriptional regulator [Mycobacterium sherrisii]MEC4764801.1 TetR/AcrR family transcriptional regulator [Mycobacterium sherrisii]ODR03642.1 TetR family transcriptional regulator [Mycobacterium sherrisii]ORW72533.1 TetR family transcriptional regulator [Mycobacterium sherrisii]
MTSARTAIADVRDVRDPFRMRLLDGLATAINERGYRASTVADIVRHARTSKRTFYDHFASKEACFLELLANDLETLGARIAATVDPEADWQHQIRQAVQAYVAHIEGRPAITLSWIRELPGLGAAARPVQRSGMQSLSDLLIALSSGAGFQRANLPPLTAPLAVIMIGGLRELTAITVEDGRPVREVIEPAVDACIALLGPRR